MLASLLLDFFARPRYFRLQHGTEYHIVSSYQMVNHTLETYAKNIHSRAYLLIYHVQPQQGIHPFAMDLAPPVFIPHSPSLELLPPKHHERTDHRSVALELEQARLAHETPGFLADQYHLVNCLE